MRFLFAFLALTSFLRAAVPLDLAAALQTFRSDAPHGWSFTLTTVAEGKSTVERSDAAKPDFDRWSLVQKDGRAPGPDDLRDYAEARSRRSRGGTAPKLAEQFDPGSFETISITEERATYRCRLRPGEARDNTASFLRATVVLHKPTQTIESIELTNISTFHPAFGVTITEMRTLMTYSLPDAEKPSLPQLVSTRVRGTAFIFKSLDAEMKVTFTEYTLPKKR